MQARTSRRLAPGGDLTYTLQAEEDRVESLPGAPGPLKFGMFAGNITVDEAAGRALFYVFVERDTDPTSGPVIIWLNGGPGCSSLGGGFLSELGPFFPHQKGQALKENPYAWNRQLASVIFLESPAFVGFSFSKDPSDAVVGDRRTALDARHFLLGWLKRFPQYAAADVFISGESYGGHYVPNLALEIVRGNMLAAGGAADADADSSGGGGMWRGHINLRGFLVGNAWTDAAIDNEGALDFWYTHALISRDSRDGIKEHCNFSHIGPLSRGSDAIRLGLEAGLRPGRVAPAALAAAAADGSGPGAAARGALEARRALEALQADADSKCNLYVDQAFSEIAAINIYDIYADVCDPGPPPEPPVRAAAAAAAAVAERSGKTDGKSSGKSGGNGGHGEARGRYRGALLGEEPLNMARRAAAGGVGVGGVDSGVSYPQPGRVPRYDPCIDNKVDVYLNKPEVQAALHANQSGVLPGPWQDCTRDITYSRADLLSGMIPVYQEIMERADLLIWVFSGDVDGIVPVLGSRRWIESLNLKVTAPWRYWQSQTGQVGGWRVDYDGISFVTVRNAGHMVPYVQPERAYHLLADFLAAAATPAPSRA